MINRRVSSYLGFVIGLILCQTCFADEVWNSNRGEVIYDSDVGQQMVWSYKDNGTPGLIYIDNIASGIYNQGYWVQTNSPVKCSSEKMMKNGSSAYWGHFEIQFLDSSFPRRWQAKWGYCDQKPTQEWTGTPLVG